MHIIKLISKNMLRHKLRTLLTISGIAIAVVSFGLLRTVVTAWYAGVDASSANRLITRHSVSFIFPLPLAYRDRISKLDGVDKVTYANWFGGVYVDKKQFFARLAVDAETFFDVYPEYVLPKGELETFKRERNSCIVGEQLVQRYGFKIGDVIPIDGDIYPGKWEFVIRGIYKPRDKTSDPSNMLVQWQYLEERLKEEMPARAGYVGWYIVQIHDPNNSGIISSQIDQQFKNSPAETKSETEKAFQQSFMASVSSIITAMDVMSFVIIGIILLVLGNTMVMSARERIREYAVLKTLGFSSFHLIGLIGGESLTIAIAGGSIGILLAYPMIDGFAAVLPKGWFPIFNLEPITLVLASISALLVGILAAIFPIQRATSTKIVDGLRQVG
ncbi:MAG: ABC transporter permease [Ignavibacteriales bacterium]|nr:ABC transporter permease [Ignavibacteriales bacterium]